MHAADDHSTDRTDDVGTVNPFKDVRYHRAWFDLEATLFALLANIV